VIITVDPNVRGCGVSGFLKGILQWAVYVKNPLAGTRQYAVDVAMGEAVREAVSQRYPFQPSVVIIERPRIYPGMPDTDLNDLIDVGGVGSACATHFSKVQTVFPERVEGSGAEEDHARAHRGEADARRAARGAEDEQVRHRGHPRLGRHRPVALRPTFHQQVPRS
jgi:hypothetical protein